jgi:hypothetical protein
MPLPLRENVKEYKSPATVSPMKAKSGRESKKGSTERVGRNASSSSVAFTLVGGLVGDRKHDIDHFYSRD